MIGTAREITLDSSFSFLANNRLDEKQNLHIFVELGYFYIQPRNSFASGYMFENTNNPYYPGPGGKQGESFVKNASLKKSKSKSLQSVTNGVMPNHLNVSGAPYCTFIEGSLVNKTHVFYDLIKGPTDAVTYPPSSTLEFVQNQPVILNQFFQSLNTQESRLFNTLGEAFIPGTSKTSNAIESLKLPTLTSYNIWSIDNIAGSEDGDKLLYFNYEEYLGFVPKNGIPVDKVQPYAQTWSFTDTAQIQVYASNSQVSLTRMYPINKDYAHDPKASYLIFNAVNNESFLEKNPIGLSKEASPVGFVIKFSSVVLSNNPPVQATSDSTVVASPRMIISWGDLEADEEKLQNEYTAKGIVGKYTLELSPNQPPRLFVNINDSVINNVNVSANGNSVELNNLKPLVSSDYNSGSKTPNDYMLFVYYTGPYLMIGNSQNPSEWQTVGNIPAQLKNTDSKFETKTLKHNLNQDARIRMQAQYMNFVYSYGPPLFSPHDDQNIPALTEDVPNTLNFAEGYFTHESGESAPTPETIQKNIVNNAASTFQDTNDVGYIGGATAYHDIRAEIKPEDYGVSIQDISANSYHYKITMPKNLGGNVFNKFMPTEAPEPDIKNTYTFYDLNIQDGSSEVSDVLSNSVTSLSISKKIDNDSASVLTSSLNIEFLNLNKSEDGLKIIQFMRQNVCSIRVSAGYGTLYPFFEGMVGEIKVTESLDKSVISVGATDLLTALFLDPSTLIMSRQIMQFPGMRLKDIVNSLVYNSELNDHFRYDLGPSSVEGTLMYALENDPKYRLPRIADTAVLPYLSLLRVNAYDDTKNTYLSVLKTVAKLSIQVNEKPGDNKRFDAPIYYWYTSGSNRFSYSDSFNSSSSINGIIMSSRTLPKDKDVFYLRMGEVTDLMTRDINLIHGVLSASNPFESSSNSENLSSEGLYRFIDIGTDFQLVNYVNQNAFGVNENSLPFTNSIDNTIGYIGYQRIKLFDNPDQPFAMQTSISNIILPEKSIAQNFINRRFAAAYQSVYETVSLNAYVTQPLKEWGYFTICVETPENEMPNERYLYAQVNYTFNINQNLISVAVNGSRQIAQNL